MLDQKDLELIAKLNQDSEARLTAQMIQLNKESEQRMMAYTQKLTQESEMRMMALMEAYFEPKFQALNDRLDLMMERKASTEVTEDLDERVTYLEGVVENNTKDIMLLKAK